MITDKISYKKNKKNYEIFCAGIGKYDGCHINGYRYKLEITIDTLSKNKSKSNKTLACIMMNPSTTFPDIEWNNKDWALNLKFIKFNKKPQNKKGFDPTVKNVIKMAHSKGYSNICIFNLFPLINPNGNEARNKYKTNQNKNIETIRNWTNKYCKEVLIAWGNTLPKGKLNKDNYKKLQEQYISIFEEKNIKPVYYEWNKKSKCPYHPSVQVNNLWYKNDVGEIVRKEKGSNKPGIIQQFIDDEKAGFKPYPKQ